MSKKLNLKEGWSTLFLVLAMILTTATALYRTDMISGLQIIPTIGATAVFAGFILAKSRFTSRTAHFLSFIYGSFFLIYMLGSLMPDSLSWNDRIISLIDRMAYWVVQLVDGSTSRDRIIFVIHTSIIYWLLGYTAAWYTFRRPRVWRVVVPMGLLLLSVVYYYTGPRRLWGFLLFYLFLALLYIARTHLLSKEEEWRETAVRYDSSIWISFMRAGLMVAIVGIFIAWGMPQLHRETTAVISPLSGTQGTWRDMQDTWTRVFASLRSAGTETADPYLDTILLGGARTVGDGLVMDVAVNERLPYAYWQAVAYDTYEDGLWSVTDTETSLHFPDDGNLDVPNSQSRQRVNQTITNYLPTSSVLYGAPEFRGSDRQMYVDAARNETDQQLIASIQSRYVLGYGDQYEILSSLSVADALSLRQASTNYPAWVTDRYLQLSETTTAETIALAEELTAPHGTVFDQSIAIRDYLRLNINYNDQIDRPPSDVDPVHHILFNSQEGYCTYYASSMVMMLRSQGIPSRFVSGYAQGEYNADTHSYRVRAPNAHTWVEVYFPAYGWIQFEPTASIPTVARPESLADSGGGDAFDMDNTDPELTDEERLAGLLEPEVPDEGVLDENALDDSNSVSRINIPIWSAVSTIFILLVATGVMVFAAKANQKVEGNVRSSYGRLRTWAGWLNIFYTPAHTPHERADMLTTAVPDGAAPIRNLTQQYAHQQYSQHKEDNGDPAKEWSILRPLLLRRTIVTQFKNIGRRFKRKKS